MMRRARGKRPRDNQRARLYRAETEAFGVAGTSGGPSASIGAVRNFLYGLLADDWFRSEFGNFSYVHIKDGRGTRHAYSAYEERVHGVAFSFPRWARSRHIVLHELSHAASFRRYGVVAAHGPEFAAVYLRLVSRYLGHEAQEKLRGAYLAHRVKFELAFE